MKVNYFREMRHHHLVITAGESCLIDFQMNMIKNNEINGLLCPTIRQSNDEKEYDYLITGCQSLQTYVETAPLTGSALRVLVEGLCALLEELDRYLIDGEYLCLRPEYIYLERKGDEIINVNYCLFPFQTVSFELQVRELFKYIINEVDYQEQSAVTLAYNLFQAVQESVEPSELRRIVADKTRAAELVISETVPSEAAISKATISKSAISKSEELSHTEEILWAEDVVKENVKPYCRTDRNRVGKCEIALPETKKRSIIKLITRSRR